MTRDSLEGASGEHSVLQHFSHMSSIYIDQLVSTSSVS